jgi:hypothetical protein
MIGAAMTLAFGLLAPALAYGWTGNLDQIYGWYRTVTDTSAPNLLVPENISFATLWAKWLGVDAGTAFRYGWISSAAALLLAAVVLLKRRAVREPAYLEFGLLLALVPLISPQGWDYVLLIATPAFLIVVDRWKDMTWPWRVVSATAIAGISFTIFDLIGRTLYTAAMRYNVVTVAAVLLIASLANLRFRRLA